MLFRALIALVSLLPQIYLFIRVRRWMNAPQLKIRNFRIPVYALFALFNLLLIWLIATQPRQTNLPEWALYTVLYPFLLWHLASFIFTLILIGEKVLRLPDSPFWSRNSRKGGSPQKTISDPEHSQPEHSRVEPLNPSRRAFLRHGAYGLAAVSFGGMAYTMISGGDQCEMNEREVRINGLPPALSGLAIGLVTDIHSSRYMLKPEMDEYVRRMNDMGVDLFVLGGDLVDARFDEIHPFAEAFSRLVAPLGVYGVLGNRDHFTRQPDEITRIAREAGMRILRNESMVIRKNGSSFRLAGVDDAETHPAAGGNMDAALKSGKRRQPTVLLCHRPTYLAEASTRDVDLMLSGHTHGGQIVFGRIGRRTITPRHMSAPYVWGLYRKEQTQMYVSRGIGTAGLPIRINCPPELTRIVLRPA
jgi:uncharacterized protein